MVTQLTTDKVQYQLADGGRRSWCPSRRSTPSASRSPPQASRPTGYSLLDQMGVTSSEFQQNVTYKRAIEGELAKTIEAMDGVKTA